MLEFPMKSRLNVSTKVRSWLKKTARNQKRYVMVEKEGKKSKWLTESCIWKWSSCFVSVLSSVFPPPHPPSPPRANLSGACCLSLTLQTDYCLPWRKDCYLTRKCLSIVADHLCGCYQSHSCTEAGCSEGWGEKAAAAASVRAASTGTACWLKAKLLLFLYSNLKRGKKVLYCNERQCWCRNLCRCRRGLGRHRRCLNGTTRPPTPLPPEAVAVQWDAIPSENIRPSEEWSGTGGGFLIPWCTILMASPAAAAAAVVNELRTRRCW